MEELITTLDLRYVWDEILVLVRNPYSNLRASLMLLGAVVVVILLVALTSLLVLTRRSSVARSREELAELQYYALLLVEDEQEAMGLLQNLETVVPAARSVYRWPRRLGVGVGVLLVLVAILGVSTSRPYVCLSCHDSTRHSEAAASGVKDAHGAAGCVVCHESSGWLGRVTIEVPGRAVHLVEGFFAESTSTALTYGAVTSSACYRCHGSIGAATTLDEVRGLRMAHREPLAAGAQCLDCHTLEAGVVSRVISGMGPCLRCHDGSSQPTTCSLCHSKDPSAAARSRTTAARMQGRRLIPTPNCGSCHDERTQCDPCHGGVRMPHTDLFMAYGHAREGVKSIWYRGGRTCGRCHTASRRPCARCHVFLPTASHGVSWASGHIVQGSAGCDGCHSQWAYLNGRDFCGLCHGEPFVKQ